MDLTAILGFLIGMVTIYAVMAMMASAVQEYIAGLFTLRGKYLTRALDLMLQAGNAVTSSSLKAAQPTPLPSGTIDPNKIDAAAILNHPLVPGSAGSPPSYIAAPAFAAALLNMLHNKSANGDAVPTIESINKAIDTLPEPLKKTMQALVADAGQNLDVLKARIEAWFDGTMDRLSGVYKRHAQYTLVAIGFVLALVFNVNSFHVAATLWRDPPIREAMVAMAGNLQANEQMPAVQQRLEQFQAAHLPIGWPSTRPAETARPLLARIKSFFDRATTFRQRSFEDFFSRVPGWIVTALAITLGAPFWFNLLQNLLNLRNAGPKPPSRTSTT